ncbi:helix-turn-helix transcriptional regulator [Burkholderia gladioli]|uniref:helix-turn-helix transcriptional regulator n=1 Tax=Burkholderia gladioli TaxID=28095 RepID=UPI0016405FAD|nr:helix-turn-helix domain-containing protein [Burkholderia gladioli]
MSTATDRVTAAQAAVLTGRGVSTISLAARSGDLPFTVVRGVRRFALADLHAWQAAKHAPPTGPFLSFSDAWRLIGYANRSSITRAIKAGRLAVVLDKQGRPRLNRADVETLVAERAAKKAKREARA